MACCLFALLILAAVVAAVKVFVKLTTGWDKSPKCLVGKTAIVTGANTGIGFYTAQDFAKRGAKVILACRNQQKAEEAKERIIQATGNSNVHVKIVDVSSLASVRKFAKEISETEERLDILVNNAGAGGLDFTLTEDELPLLMQTNYYGPFLLTILLLKLLKKSAPSRIVNVASAAAQFASINAKKLNMFPKGYGGYLPKVMDYCNTKFCNVIFTNELSRRLRNSGIDTNSLHPGLVHTEITKNYSHFFKSIADFGSRCFGKTPQEGAQTTIYVAVSDEVKDISGKYFVDCRVFFMPSGTDDVELARKIWETTEELIQLTAEEKKILNEI